MTLLQVSGLRKSFGGLAAVDGVDFSLEQGEIRAVIGPNGAGKSTFVGLIAGRIAPDQGRIVFADADITHEADFRRVRRGIAYTFQITSIYGSLSVAENIALAAGGTYTSDAANALARVGLADRSRQTAGTLAYGHQRLLEVAMGLALKPRLLILDEPTQGLSDSEISNFVTLVREIGTVTTILLIEHNMKLVMELADKITVLNRGSILAEGKPAEIRANSHVRSVYLGNE